MDAISTDELREKIDNHFSETKKQKERLRNIFDELNITPEGTLCEGMKGLLEECDKVVNNSLSGVVKDAALIGALQKCEHYQIATYGTLKTFAKHLELDAARNTLEEILKEEWNADKNLTTLAEGGWFKDGINIKAAK